jgi:hypothetical protein
MNGLMRQYGLTLLVCGLLLLGSGVVALADQVTLVWQPNPETDLAGYKIYRSTTAGKYGAAPLATVTAPTTTFSVDIPRGAAGVTYFFVVTAFDLAKNESAYSNEVSKLIPAIEKPITPALSMASRTTNSITVTYVPIPDGAGGFAKVIIRVAPTPLVWSKVLNAPCSASPCVLAGLKPDTSYEIAAASYVGPLTATTIFSDVSLPLTVKTMAIDLPPAAPTGLSISQATAMRTTHLVCAGDLAQWLGRKEDDENI